MNRNNTFPLFMLKTMEKYCFFVTFYKPNTYKILWKQNVKQYS